MKDILIFISDQHSPLYSEFGGGKAETPELNRLCREGTSFTECYTSSPLCVPARMSMLTGRLPSANGVMVNLDTIPDLMPTFLHPFVAAGYETVLIGRMHFVGKDQRHGFTKRLAPDMTPVTWNRPVEKLKEERGVFHGTYDARGCLRVIGGGETPVVHYDEMVVKTALEYLSQEHEKPQLIVVGTYAPHFPYVAPEKWYRKYRESAVLPNLFHETPDYMNPILVKRKNLVDEDTVLAAQSAYLGLVTYTDQKVGEIWRVFRAFAERRKGESLFCYLSDHGDQVGERDIFGKCTFFEKSAKIPMIFQGSRIPKGRKIPEPASIMDLGPTLCEWAGAEQIPDQDGKSLMSFFQAADLQKSDERIVISEILEQEKGELRVGLMLRKGCWKYIVYSGYEDQDILFDLSQDPDERVNVADQYPEAAKEFRKYVNEHYSFEEVEKEQKKRAQIASWMTAWERQVGENDSERWSLNPDSAKGYPSVR